MEQQLPGGPVWLPALDLEKWYQKVMAGFETSSSSSVSPPSSPPPLPAKAHSSHKPIQVTPAPCCWGSGFRTAGHSGSWAVRGCSCWLRALGAARHLLAAAGRGARADPQWAGSMPGVGSHCLLLPAHLQDGTQGQDLGRGGSALPTAELFIQGGLSQHPHAPLTSVLLCPGLSCQDGG